MGSFIHFDRMIQINPHTFLYVNVTQEEKSSITGSNEGVVLMTIEYKDIYEKALYVLTSKKEELQLYGYDAVTTESIWTFCVHKVWRNEKIDELSFHRIVNDIFKISPAAYMTYTQIEEQRDANLLSDLNRDELDILLGKKDE